MKKLLTLVFALAVAFSLTLPVFAQDTSGQTTPPAKTTKKEKAKKAPKAKKEKKQKKEDTKPAQ